MRILLLAILILAPVYYVKYVNKDDVQKIDDIKLKISAPQRAERILTVQTEVIPPPHSQDKEQSSEQDPSTTDEEGEREYRDHSFEEVEQVEVSGAEENWNLELKDILNRIDPIEGDQIHKAYVQEYENYQAMMESLISEKQQKTSEESILEIDQLMTQLDEKYQAKIKTILGPHFDTVDEIHEEYLQSSASEE